MQTFPIDGEARFLGEYRGQPAVQNANRALLEPSAFKPADYNRLVRYQGRTINQKAQDASPLSLRLRRSNAR